MGPWRIRQDHPSRVFERPLGDAELGFYWDRRFQGTADTLQHSIVELSDPTNRELFKEENIKRAWCALKHRYPLLGSYVEEGSCGGQTSFVVTEDRLDECVPEEITLYDISSLVAAQKYIEDVINGEPILSDFLLARIAILSRVDKVHIFFHIAHCITDGVANLVVLRTFLDILSSPGIDLKWDLKKRLALSLPSNDLVPPYKMNQTLYKWKYAIGRVLAGIRISKITGGHTLPRNFTHLTRYTPARSGAAAFSFMPQKSSQIINKCRENNLTFGNVYPVIAQVALTRLLCRRYISGNMTSAEWEYRRREPMVTGGPLSLRPFLDREWYQMGGSTNVMVAIGFFFFRLPYMPLGAASSLAPGDKLPDVLDLLPFKRFLLRCQMIKKQTDDLLKHPLFLHICTARSSSTDQFKYVAENWRSKQEETTAQLSLLEQSPVLSHGGASLGNIDGLLPSSYPLTGRKPSSPVVHLSKSETRLRCRPAELYLGASMRNQQLHLIIFWDMNVYEERTVQEWLDEVKEAIEAFLGDGQGNIDAVPDARL